MKRRNWFPWTCGVLLLVGLPLQIAVLPGLVDAPYYRALRIVLSAVTAGSAAGLVGWAIQRRNPEKKRQAERAERDERNRMIWEKAAYFTWQATLFFLLVAYIVLDILECTPGVAAVLAVLLLSFITYLAATRFYEKRY